MQKGTRRDCVCVCVCVWIHVLQEVQYGEMSEPRDTLASEDAEEDTKGLCVCVDTCTVTNAGGTWSEMGGEDMF